MQRSKTKKKVKNKKKVSRSSGQKKKYSGKKKRHTQKIQVIQNTDNQMIISLDFGLGSCHDFNLYKKSRLKICPKISQTLDKGYVGVLRFHANSEVPKKSSKKHPLTKEDKKSNRNLAKTRIGIEHCNRKLKISKILQSTYRNHKKFELRATLIATFHNGLITTKCA